MTTDELTQPPASARQPAPSPNSAAESDLTPGTAPSVFPDRYTDLDVLPTLAAELALPLVLARSEAPARTVVLCALGADGSLGGSGPEPAGASKDSRLSDRLIRRYSRVTGSQVEHFGVPEIVDSRSPEAGAAYVAWAVEPGRSLRSLLERNEFPNSRRILEIGRGLAETLAELHRFDQQVSTLSPATTWLGPAGLCQILALGIEPPSAGTVTGPGLRYRAPEQLTVEPRSMSEALLAGPLRERADLWSLGVILLELCDRRPRLQCTTARELLREIQQVSWYPPADTPVELAQLLRQLLVVDVEARTLTAEEVGAALDDMINVGSRSVSRENPAPAAPPPEPTQRTGSSDQASTSVAWRDDWTWRSALREASSRRRAWEQAPDISWWRVWLPLAAALVLLGLLMGWLLTLR